MLKGLCQVRNLKTQKSIPSYNNSAQSESSAIKKVPTILPVKQTLLTIQQPIICTEEHDDPWTETKKPNDWENRV